MRNDNDLTGNRYGQWLVLRKDESRNNYYICRCDCGTERPVYGPDLKRGQSASCGCRQTSKYAEMDNIYHHLFGVWKHMRERCNNINNSDYKWYGGRGIKVSPEWSRFSSFYSWGLTSGYKLGLTLDRKDNDGPYSPDNCRWVTMTEQANNRSNNHCLTINGITKTIAQWSRDTGIHKNTIRNRLVRGKSGEQLIATPKTV